MSQRYPLLGLSHGMVLVVGRLFGPIGWTDPVMSLDTGSSITLFTPRLLQEVGLDPAEATARRSVYTYDGAAELPVLQVPHLRVFGQEVHDLEVACGELPPKLGLDGVLGLNFLWHFDLRINFREEYIELH
ncbi:MAG: retropepsin-like aspartic protease [Anaerolineae bacterium]